MTAAIQTLPFCDSSVACALCGLPADARAFDVSSLKAPPKPGRVEVLARFDLPAEYCGTLEYFAQFSDVQARDPSRIRTPGLRWSVRVNQRPLHPYVDLDYIVNPWGIGGFPVKLRLDDGAVLELVIRMDLDVPPTAPGDPKIALVGGRLLGRYWYNRAFGDVERARR